jgi:hypothetical protein
MSEKFTIIKEDLIKVGKGLLIALSGSAIVFLSSVSNVIDWSRFGSNSQLYMLIATAISSSIVNLIRKWVGTTEY